MYASIDFKTKKAFREAVEAYNAYIANPSAWRAANTPIESGIPSLTIGAVLEHKAAIRDVRPPKPVTLFAPGLGSPKVNGIDFVEGPQYPKPHTWYAQVTMQDGVVVKVK